MENTTASALQMQGVGLGIASGAVIPAFELFTGGKGIISIISGAATLGYGIYRYRNDTIVIDKQRNIGDSIADIFDVGLDTAKGALWGVSHIYIVGVLAAGGIALYLLSGVIKVQPSTSISLPAILGSMMGIGGGVLLYLDGDQVQQAVSPDIAHSIGHDIVETAKQGLSNDANNIIAATTATGWDTFEYNVTHPQDYFPAYGQRVQSAWQNIHDVGSFWNAWTTTFSIVGDMFTTDKPKGDPLPPTVVSVPGQRYYYSTSLDDFNKQHTAAGDDDQLRTAQLYYEWSKTH